MLAPFYEWLSWCPSDLWKEAGSPKKKDPSTWSTRESATELIDTVCGI
jgi:hypothetical protein